MEDCGLGRSSVVSVSDPVSDPVLGRSRTETQLLSMTALSEMRCEMVAQITAHHGEETTLCVNKSCPGISTAHQCDERTWL